MLIGVLKKREAFANWELSYARTRAQQQIYIGQ